VGRCAAHESKEKGEFPARPETKPPMPKESYEHSTKG
jgi:hypothetical protein